MGGRSTLPRANQQHPEKTLPLPAVTRLLALLGFMPGRIRICPVRDRSCPFAAARRLHGAVNDQPPRSAGNYNRDMTDEDRIELFALSGWHVARPLPTLRPHFP